MNAENVKQCLAGIGCNPERANGILEFLEADRLTEGKQKLRCLRCELMDELHGCQRRIDQLDWLMREAEKSHRSEK